MKNKLFQLATIFLAIIIIGIVIAFVFFSNTSNAEHLLKEKVTEEIRYLDQFLVSMLNKVNHIQFENYRLLVQEEKTNEQSNTTGSSESGGSGSSGGGSSSSQGGSGSEESSSGSESNTTPTKKYGMVSSTILTGEDKEIDWDTMKKNIENIYPIWTNMVVDFNQIGISNDSILSFGNLLDTATKAIKEEQKQQTLVTLSNLYDCLPSFVEQSAQSTKSLHIAKTKANVLKAYTLVETDQWDAIQKQIRTAQEEFLLVMNEAGEDDSNNNALSRIYVYLNDIGNSVQNKEKDSFFIKYKNLCEALTIYQETA